MTGREQLDAAQAARDLTAALNGMSARLDEVRKDSEDRDEELAVYGKRNRHLIWLTIASVVLDVVLTVALGLVAVSAHNASTAARRASASNLALCQAGNTARAQQIQLWDFVLGLSRGHPQTARERQIDAAFEARLNHLFAPRDCAHLPATRS